MNLEVWVAQHDRGVSAIYHSRDAAHRDLIAQGFRLVDSDNAWHTYEKDTLLCGKWVRRVGSMRVQK